MRRTTLTATVMNLLLAPNAGGRKHPAAAWGKAVSAILQATGQSVDGDEAFVEERGFLLSCLAAEPGLTPLGWQSALDDAKRRLENRLRINRVIAEHPAILEEEIRSPVFVVGLPRTATTLAQRVLAASADHRGPTLAEMSFTDLETDPAVLDQRTQAVAKRVRALTRIAPSFEVIHPIRAHLPEESIYLMPHGAYQPILRAPMPKYRAWLRGRDVTPDYEYLRRALQVLQHGRERKRWILKYPGHLGDLDTIRKVFPDAVFVWTHRDPTTALGSLCSLIETSWSIYLRRPDLHTIGRVGLEMTVDIVERGRASRLSLPPGSIVDVHYHLLSADPRTQVPGLYRAIGATWTDADARNLENVLARPDTDRRHEYSVDRYGLDLLGIERAFGDYPTFVARFNR